VSATHVAIVGSGPSGFYVAEALLRANSELLVTMIEQLPTPFGLVRAGVAPDHPKIKQVSAVYDRIARSRNFRFVGNVSVGRDVTVDELSEFFHAVVFATGATRNTTLGISGESLPGSYLAGDFVGWYNGHPSLRDRKFDLSHEVAVVIGQGNVATDICRMLLTPPEALAQTDIATYALDALRASRVREVHVIGRRGPAQAKFTNAELRELGEIENCDVIVDSGVLDLSPACQAEIADSRGEIAAKNLDILRRFSQRQISGSRRCCFRFYEAPQVILGEGKVERVLLARTRLEGGPFRQTPRITDQTVSLECGAVFTCIGFRGEPIAGLPFDRERGVIPNRRGRVVCGDVAVDGMYATGWIKRGPAGIIGTNRADGVETAQALLEDLAALRRCERPGETALREVLNSRGTRVVTYDDWLVIDATERERGTTLGKVREKFTRIDEMLGALGPVWQRSTG
jgi:ferredoxin--NADP+ reductase